MLSNVRTLLIVGVLLAFTGTSPVLGQEYTAGIKVGVSTTTLSGTSDTELTWRSAFAGGFVFGAKFFNSIAIQPEIIYVVKGASTDNIFQAGEPTGLKGVFSFSYVDVPLLVSFSPLQRSRVYPKVFAGPFLSYQLDASLEQIEPVSGNSSTESVDTIHDTDFGLVVGTGADFDIRGERVTFDVRYVWGRNNIRQNVPDSPLYNRSILFLVGVSF
jgi:hypothetical protein